jgi:hypothetical protein
MRSRNFIAEGASPRRFSKRLASHATQAYMNPRVQTGRYRSGQTGQTVNLLALRLRWFESSPAQSHSGLRILSSLFAGRLRGDRRIRVRHRRRAVVRAGEPHSQSTSGLR